MKKDKPAREYSLNPAAVLRLYRRLASHMRPHRRHMFAASLCMLGAAAAELIKPWPIKVIFDAILAPQHNRGWLLEQIGAFISDPQILLATMVGSIFAIAVVAGVFGYGQSYLLSLVGQRVVTSIRIELYSHIQRLSQSFHDERSTGDLMTRLTGDVRMMRELLVNSILTMAARLLIVLGSLAVMFVMDWRLALVAVAVVPALTLASWRFSGRIKGAVRQQRRKESRLAHVMAEGIGAIKVVQAFAREAHEQERFASQNKAGADADVKAARLEAHMERIVQIILACGTCGVVWYGVTRVQAGMLTPGDLLVFMAYLAGLYRPIRKLSSITGRMSKATVSGERILDILDLQPDVRNLPDAIAAGPFLGSIEFSNVSFAYGRGTPVLHRVHFHIRAGEAVALMSESGSGKSTVASLLLRFYDPIGGSIIIDGLDTSKMTLESLRQQFAIVMQDSVLFDTSIRENIAYGRLDATEQEIVAAARAAGAHDFIMSLPEGYGTVAGERGALLSGGQRQRIAIARAFIRNASILILDEPLTGLDRDNEDTVRLALRRLMAGRTTLIITHDPATARMASRVLTIRDARVLELSRGPSRLEAAQ